MPEASSQTPAPQGTAGDSDAEDLQRYRAACEEVDRLLDQGRLSEAVALNEEVRTLFRRLFSSGQLG